MKKDFWLERWNRGEIGFHQDEINPYLCQHWQELYLAPNSQVFVPLCGKSRDMLWLREKGHRILGVELSEVAVRAFFKENGYSPHRVTGDRFDSCEANGICILCGDFFDINKEDLADVGAVYDRASLIALPPDMRARYARHLAGILPPATHILLVTLEYPQVEMQGPPFSVTNSEVKKLYRDYADVRLIEQQDVLAKNLRFLERGLSRLQESLFLLTTR